jgi:hypothetical protein
LDSVHLNDIFVMSVDGFVTSVDGGPRMKIGGIGRRRNVLGRQGFKSTGCGVGSQDQPSGEMHE